MPKAKGSQRVKKAKTAAASPAQAKKKKEVAKPTEKGAPPKRSRRVKAAQEVTGAPSKSPPVVKNQSTADRPAKAEANSTATRGKPPADDKDRQIKDLSDKLSRMFEDYDDLSAKYEVCYGCDKFFGSSSAAFWGDPDGAIWGRDLRAQSSNIYSWVKNYCSKDPKVMDVPLFPSAARCQIAGMFLVMFVVKDLIEKFSTNPFWYYGTDPKTAMKDERRRQEQKDFAESLYALDRQFRKGSPSPPQIVASQIAHAAAAGTNGDYQAWRVATCRLANVYGHKQRGPNHEFGEATKKYRDTLVPAMVDKILCQKLAQLLLLDLKKNNPGDKPYDSLLKIYNRAAQNSMNISFWNSEPFIHTLEDISLKFEVKSESTMAAPYQFLDEDDTRLDGKRVLALWAPGLLTRSVTRYDATIGAYTSRDRWCLKANVFVEDP
ncbi:hypothetical protein BDW74DRAFT_181452 [Aspergillus multicolor]|uniref:uncharacterized protein n=1 Tax=Aspergillus multicolor TaxID=41759 RepID=UPI003CCD4F40